MNEGALIHGGEPIVSASCVREHVSLGPDASKASRIYVVEEHDNPSSEYFVLPNVQAYGCPVHQCKWSDVPDRQELRDAVVVFVRYVPPAWKKLVAGSRSMLHELVFFMDDDLFDLGATRGLAPWYRFKLMRYSRWQVGWLRAMRAKLWVSTVWLAKKYANWEPFVVYPRPIADLRVDPSEHEGYTVFYHGSPTHREDIRWLYEVIHNVHAVDERIVFELIGGPTVRKLYQDLPYVNVVNPMEWPEYKRFLSSARRDIGLAPLVDHPFNHSRSYTKFFDITRAGAIGIYAENGAWRSIIRDGEDGFLLPMDQALWTKKIISLASDEALRTSVLINAQDLSRKLRDLPAESSGNRP